MCGVSDEEAAAVAVALSDLGGEARCAHALDSRRRVDACCGRDQLRETMLGALVQLFLAIAHLCGVTPAIVSPANDEEAGRLRVGDDIEAP